MLKKSILLCDTKHGQNAVHFVPPQTFVLLSSRSASLFLFSLFQPLHLDNDLSVEEDEEAKS